MALPTVILPGYLASAQPYQEMEAALAQEGFVAVTVPLRRRDWLSTIGGRSVIDIIQALDATAQRVMIDHDCNQINLVGHSAGGWIARIYLGELPYDIHSSDRDRTLPRPARAHVRTLVTLGTPHTSQERWTRKNLDFVNDTYPGAFYEDVDYTCVAGKAIFSGRGDTMPEPLQGRIASKKADWFTVNSYKMTAGSGDLWGDGVVPLPAAQLEGARNIVLDDVQHSPRKNALWYGSPSVVKDWSKWLA